MSDQEPTAVTVVNMKKKGAGLVSRPFLRALYFKQNRNAYYDLLDRVRRDGDWESWLHFFLTGVQTTADGAVSTANRLSDMFVNDRERIKTLGRRASTVLRVHDALKARPITTVQDATNTTGLSFPAVSSAMNSLSDLGISKELTGKQRNRLFVYSGYVSILNEGTEPFA